MKTKLVKESLKDTILQTLGKETHWPGIHGYKVKMSYGEAFFSEAEYNLRMYLQETSKIDYEKLWALIEDYGLERYEDGVTSESMSRDEDV